MIVLFLLIVILLVGLTAAAVMGRIGGFMAEPTASQAFPGLSGVSADDIKQLRFDRALRGYRMDQVDEVVDVLGARVRELENQVASAGTEGSSHVATDTQEH